jgi:hypothetical protein
LGLAQYRAHQYDLAVQNLQESNAGHSTRLLKAANWLLLAMIHCRQAQPEEARQCWDVAHRIIDHVRPKKPGDPVAAFETDWIELNVLLPEADALLKEQTSAGRTNTADN